MQRLLGTRSPIFGSSSSSPGSEVVRPSNRDVVLLQDPSHNPQTGIIIAKIEEILAANLDALRENRALTIPIRNRRTGRLRLVRFPSSRDTDAKKFSMSIDEPTKVFALVVVNLRVLFPSLCSCSPSDPPFIPRSTCCRYGYHEEVSFAHAYLLSMVDQRKCRAIYYQNPELFGNQQYVDQLVDDIAFTLGFGRDALNIVATSKGLVAGAVNITISNGSSLSCNSEDGKGVLLPDVRVITGITLGAVEWLLVIEKEATFRGLAASNFHESAKVGRGILITAKGYPDLSTRQFLHKLYATFPMMPMFGLVDFDQHEENTTLNRLSWIGPRSGDIFGHYHRNSASTDSNQTNVFHLTPSQEFSLSQPNASPYPSIAHSPIEVTLPLTARDRRSATRLLSATVGKDDAESLDFIRELQVMLLINTKAEIQAVDEAGDLSAWLDNALTKAMRGV